MAGPFVFMPGSCNNNNFSPPPRYESNPAAPETGQRPFKIVAVFGKTGTGKSSFIKAVTGKDLKIGHGLKSCTKDVLAVPCKIDGQDVILMDTPGFDDTNDSDANTLTRIADWMKSTYDDGSLLSGIIYLHRISDTRMDGASMKNLRMFRKLCGANNLHKVILATTMWEKVSVAEGEMREAELKNDFWRDMISLGSTVAKVSNIQLDAIELVKRFLDKSTMVLKLQEELSSGKSLMQTEAGAAINEDIEKIRLQYGRDLENKMQEMKEAQETRDRQYERQLKKEIDRVHSKLEAMRKQEMVLQETQPCLPNNRKSWWRRRWRCLNCSNKSRAIGKWTCENCRLKQRNVGY